MKVEEKSAFATIEEAIEDIRQGKFVVVVDAADRENEGDLTIAAQFATPEAVNFMAKEGRGLICLCLTGERCDELGLRMMTEHNETPHGTAFTVSIEAREGISTGISAHDRARTIQVAIDSSKGPQDMLRYCVEKGSVAVDGVSLTVAALDETGFAVALIPHTLDETTFGALAEGDGVNLEVDILAKYVERLLPSTMSR